MKKLLPVAFAGLCLLAIPVSALWAADTKDGSVHLTCNTEANEVDPQIAPSGLYLLYSCDAAGKYDIMYSARSSVRQVWPKGQSFEGDYIQSKVDDRSTFLTTDIRYPQYLFFATRKDREINNFDIYVATRLSPRATYTAPSPLNTISTEADELHPWLTADGRRLYFSRKTKDGWKVLVASRTITTGAAGFEQPEELKDLPVGFHHPTLTRDGRTMYLQGPLEKGRWGLFVTTLSGRKWSKPEPLSVNSPDAPTGDVSPCLSRDGRMLYFASDRPGGKGKMDLWVIAVNKLRKAR